MIIATGGSEKKRKRNRLVHILRASWAECEFCLNYETGTCISRLALSSYIDCVHLNVPGTGICILTWSHAGFPCTFQVSFMVEDAIPYWEMIL